MSFLLARGSAMINRDVAHSPRCLARVEIREKHCTECDDDERVGSIRSRDVDRRSKAQLCRRGAAQR